MAEVSGFARARPIRVAFLVPDDEHAHTVLDAVFANCHARWGGRYSLVVPCQAGRPRESYLSWLQLFDADIVYSYVDMDQTTLALFNERFGPSYLIRHATYDNEKRDQRYFRPELPITCLTSLAVAPQYGKAHPASAPQPMLVVDLLLGEPENRFISDNFGSIRSSFGFWPVPEQLGDVIRPLYVASEHTRSSWQMGRMPVGHFVVDVSALLGTMAQRRNSYGVSQLAADSASRLETRDLDDSALRMIVGESFADRIVFWNDRSRFPAYLGRCFTNLIVPPALLGEESFLSALGDFLKARNEMRPSTGTPWVELTSTSVPLEELKEIAASLRVADRWNAFHVRSLASIDQVPSAGSIEKAKRGLMTGRNFDPSPTWREFPAHGSSAQPPQVAPTMLDGVSPSRATEGGWALDLRLQRQNNLTQFSNVRHEWRIPRRLRIQGAFRAPYISSLSPHLHPRATLDGLLTVYTRLNEFPPAISIPDDRTAMTHALLRGRDWPSFQQDAEERPRGIYEYACVSDKGRYLLSTIGLFDGLQGAGQVLLHRFWKEAFDTLGAAVGADSKQEILKALRKRLKACRLETDHEWDRLASLVAAEAQRVRMPLRTLGLDQLKSRFQPYLTQERRALGEHKTNDPEGWLQNATASLPRAVQWLCGRGVLHQGYEWRCNECFHVNWHGVRALGPNLTCEICRTMVDLPVDQPWDFRLNDFLLEALKEHGILALIWCLIQVHDRAQNSFYFLGPTDLFENHPLDRRTPPTNELDLLCVVDGKVFLCEVKTSARGIDLVPFIAVAKKMRPDVALLGVMEPASPGLTNKLQELKEELEPLGIGAELLKLEEHHFDARAYLS